MVLQMLSLFVMMRASFMVELVKQKTAIDVVVVDPPH